MSSGKPTHYGKNSCAGPRNDVPDLRLECESSSWEVAHGFTSSHGTDYFSEERERILAGIETEVACLTAGLEQLFAILRARQGKPDNDTLWPLASEDDPIYKEGWTVFVPQGFREPSKPRGSKAKSQPSARPSSATYLFDVPEGDYRSRRAERLICRWFVDNPVGSTSCRLSLLGAPNARTFGLYFELHHLEFPESLLFAELPREVANDPSQLFEVLQALFVRNGAEDDGHYLLRCPPHAISNGEVLEVSQVKTLFTTSREVADYITDADLWWERVFVPSVDNTDSISADNV